MKTKYEFNFTDEIIIVDVKRLINQMWKLIPMFENEEDWRGQLKAVIEEVAGLSRIFIDSELELLILLSKLEGLDAEMVYDFMTYRKTVFDCISLLAKVFPHD